MANTATKRSKRSPLPLKQEYVQRQPTRAQRRYPGGLSMALGKLDMENPEDAALQRLVDKAIKLR